MGLKSFSIRYGIICGMIVTTCGVVVAILGVVQEWNETIPKYNKPETKVVIQLPESDLERASDEFFYQEEKIIPIPSSVVHKMASNKSSPKTL